MAVAAAAADVVGADAGAELALAVVAGVIELG
jgi:hypothetical protein